MGDNADASINQFNNYTGAEELIVTATPPQSGVLTWDVSCSEAGGGTASSNVQEITVRFPVTQKCSHCLFRTPQAGAVSARRSAQRRCLGDDPLGRDGPRSQRVLIVKRLLAAMAILALASLFSVSILCLDQARYYRGPRPSHQLPHPGKPWFVASTAPS